MGMYMYVSNEDRILKRKVSDKELNEEFQEALKYDPSLMIEESQRVIKNGWFGKKEAFTFYQLYHETPAFDGTAYQARYQMSGSGKKHIVTAYLHGLINGCVHREIRTGSHCI